jgi:hypothetical protein
MLLLLRHRGARHQHGRKRCNHARDRKHYETEADREVLTESKSRSWTPSDPRVLRSRISLKLPVRSGKKQIRVGFGPLHVVSSDDGNRLRLEAQQRWP